MARKSREKKPNKRKMQAAQNTNNAVASNKTVSPSVGDYGLVVVCVFTLVLGYILLYSASSYSGNRDYGDSLYFLKKQLFATLLGIVGFWVIRKFTYKRLFKFSLIIYFLSLVSVGLVRTSYGVTINGASRWVKIGFIQFQPAELVKIAVILVLACKLSNCTKTAIKNTKNCWLLFGWYIFLPAVLLLGVTSNLSSAIIVFVIGISMMFFAGASKKFLTTLFVGGGALGTAAVMYMLSSGGTFRARRLMVWLDPMSYYDSDGYQVVQGLYAIGSGGLFGKGLGNSSQKMGYLPEATNDMIFSIVVEELGVFGAICIIALFVYMIFRMRNIAANCKADMFGSLLVSGVMVHIAVQVALNIAVATNTIPNTGVSLPFISYGGTSLAFLIAEIALVYSVSEYMGGNASE